jgi:hypothetical protein
MSKLRKRITNENQLNIFEAILQYEEKDTHAPGAGSFDIDRQFRESISTALKDCPLSRYQVAARMSELVGQEITKSMLDSWTAESKELHRFPAIFLPAFCEATGDAEPLRILGKICGIFILPGPEALRSEIRKLDEEIQKRQAEKKKRIIFLKEMGEEK